MKEKHLTVKDLPVSERPYEKCEKYGVSCLSDAELLAVIIRTGTKDKHSIEVAEQILSAAKTQKGLLGLYSMNQKELMNISGIGRVKAIQLLCITELSKRMAKAKKEDKIKLITPKAVAEYYMESMRHLEKEILMLVMLNTKGGVLQDLIVSEGTVSMSLADPREVYYQALKYGAVHIILLHNHPSGDPTPSKEDIQTTKRMQQAGTLIGIPLMDHIIIGDNQYISLKEQGFL